MNTTALVANSIPAKRLGILRSTAKAAAAVAWTGVCGLAVLPSALAFPAPGLQSAWRRFVIRWWGRGVARALGMRIVAHGVPPAPPYFLVSNHLSYLDIILIASRTGCNFVARHDVRGWPGLGLVARWAGTLFIDRGNKRDAQRAMGAVERALQRGAGVTVFPEGTSTRGDRVHALKSTIFELPARLGLAVHHAVVRYETPPGAPPAHELVCWWGDMTFGGHFLELCRWPEFHAELSFGAEPVLEQDRKALARRVHEEISRRFVPVVVEEA